ncbi:hypothetical protein NDU88_001523 [Pleurodeles waltl]|uniref:Uncharacterized protein n=1 Tax=Pleurodeles waltl TaxID=8319 RepID=A0AAV7LXW0_PLEWA|nr:hypothetical protein NDU88_001523 [Pleurodeles waltl]
MLLGLLEEGGRGVEAQCRRTIGAAAPGDVEGAYSRNIQPCLRKPEQEVKGDVGCGQRPGGGEPGVSLTSGGLASGAGRRVPKVKWEICSLDTMTGEDRYLYCIQ